jgi:hypothetical protein
MLASVIAGADGAGGVVTAGVLAVEGETVPAAVSVTPLSFFEHAASTRATAREAAIDAARVLQRRTRIMARS